MTKYLVLILFLLSLVSPTTYGWMDMPWIVLFYIIAVLTIYLKRNIDKVGFSITDCCILLYFIYSLLLQLYYGINSLQNEHFVTVVIMIGLYDYFRFSTPKIKSVVLFKFIAIVSFAVILFSYYQLYNCWINKQFITDQVKFLFFNSSILAIFLAILFPIQFYLTGQNSNYYKALSYANIFLSILMIIVLKSRAAMVIAIIPVLILIGKKNGLRYEQIRIKNIISFLLIVSTIIIGLYFYKVNSSNGRLLIWQISLSHAFDNFMGIGIGNFPHQYPLWQANYFDTHAVNTDKAYLADMTFYAFNEFIQMLIEGGTVSLLLFVGFLFFTLKNGLKAFDNKESQVFSLTIIGIIIAALVGYPLHNPTIFFLLILSSAFINRNNTSEKILFVVPKNANRILYVSKLITATILLGYFISQYVALGWWRKGKENIVANETVGLRYYKKAYPLLKHKGEFLYNYAAQSFQMGMYDVSLQLFKEAEPIFSHYNLFIYKGNNNQKLVQYQEASTNFMIASNMIPSKIYPKYLLAKLYAESGDSTKAFKLAKEILLFKNKVENSTSDSIKNEMKNLLQYEK